MVAHTASQQLAFVTVAAAAVLIAGIAIFGQAAAQSPVNHQEGSAYPRLPGAVTKAPEWLVSDAPFDAAKFFAALPREHNAAPLYLDALFEFGSEVESCFPEGPERDRRHQVARDRSERYKEVVNQLRGDPNSVPIDKLDEVIKLYDVGFRKLAGAQRREQCVFETGSIGNWPLIPHVQESRTVAWIASLRVQRAVERGDFNAAIDDVETVLRLTRDLRPRGGTISQLVAAAILRIVCVNLITPILGAPGVRDEHCDRLLKVLAAHDSKSSDGYAEALRADYVMNRGVLRDLVKNQRGLAEQLRLNPGDPVVASVLGPAVLVRGTPIMADKLDALVALTTPAELSRRERELGQFYRVLLALDNVPYAARVEKIAAMNSLQGNEPLARVLRALTVPPAWQAFAQGISLATATQRATECLVALRRWQLSRRGLPSDLATVFKGTALKTLPIDPYDGKPMRLVVLDGHAVIYSVGKDGHDDGGLKDSKLDTQPGDLIFRMPPVEESRGIRPVDYRKASRHALA
jgi:hypothetical protein